VSTTVELDPVVRKQKFHTDFKTPHHIQGLARMLPLSIIQPCVKTSLPSRGRCRMPGVLFLCLLYTFERWC